MLQTIWHPSPNYDQRPHGTKIDTVIIHYTDMPNSNDALQRMCDPASKVSAHYLVDDNGTIYQLVEDTNRAWHAGISEWRGKSNVNHFSIGIELQNPGHVFYTEILLHQIIKLTLYDQIVQTVRFHCPAFVPCA